MITTFPPATYFDVRIQAYRNKTQNQSRDKLHAEHPRTARNLKGVLVGII